MNRMTEHEKLYLTVGMALVSAMTLNAWDYFQVWELLAFLVP